MATLLNTGGAPRRKSGTRKASRTKSKSTSRKKSPAPRKRNPSRNSTRGRSKSTSRKRSKTSRRVYCKVGIAGHKTSKRRKSGKRKRGGISGFFSGGSGGSTANFTVGGFGKAAVGVVKNVVIPVGAGLVIGAAAGAALPPKVPGKVNWFAVAAAAGTPILIYFGVRMLLKKKLPLSMVAGASVAAGTVAATLPSLQTGFGSTPGVKQALAAGTKLGGLVKRKSLAGPAGWQGNAYPARRRLSGQSFTGVAGVQDAVDIRTPAFA
jgi:hypothetical protein